MVSDRVRVSIGIELGLGLVLGELTLALHAAEWLTKLLYTRWPGV